MASLANYFAIGGGVRGTLYLLYYFFLVANFLQSIINKARMMGLLHLPMSNHCGEDFSDCSIC